VNLPVEVIEAVRDRRCLAFVGSRFAAEAREASGARGYTGAEVAKALGWRRPRSLPGRPLKPMSPSVQAAAAVREGEIGRSAMLAELSKMVGGDGVEPTRAHRNVAEMFERIFTTSLDSLMVDAVADTEHKVLGPGEPIGDGPLLVRLRGGFDADPIVSADDWVSLEETAKVTIRRLLRSHVVLFVGYRPDEEEFELLFEQLTDAYGAELPRCHLAVAQGRIEDYQWQRWVWRGLLLFTADPIECTDALKAALT